VKGSPVVADLSLGPYLTAMKLSYMMVRGQKDWES